MVKSVEQKWKMKEILTNLGCLWGGRGPVLQPHLLRNSAGTAISAILTILGCLWGEVEVLLLLDTSSSPQLRHLSLNTVGVKILRMVIIRLSQPD